MNDEHLAACSSAAWAQIVAEKLIPWIVDDHDLGRRLLEIGPGPGLTTDVLRLLVPQLTAVEIDAELAAALATRLEGSGIEVVNGDGTRLPFPDGCFDSVLSSMMLHHVPTTQAQDALLSEAHRVLRDGGILVGADGVDAPDRAKAHEGDIFNPVDPSTLTARLARVGFTDVRVELDDGWFRFRGRRVGPTDR